MKSPLILLPLCAVFILSACANMTETERNTAIGAGIGALGGAVISKSTGGNQTGRDAALGAGVGALGAYAWSQRMESQRQAMAQATAGTGVDVSRTANNELKLDIPSDISFDTGRAAIKPNMRPILDRFAQTRTDNTATHIRIVGHTDSTGSDAINNPLSLDRANSARNYLMDRGVASSKQIQGFFDIPVDHLKSEAIFIPYLSKLDLSNVTFASPDVGGVKRARSYAKYFERDLVICDKERRVANEVAAITVIGDVVGKDVILIDDIIYTAGTLCKAADSLIEKGAKSVKAILTHPVLSGNAYDNINNSQISKIIVTR